MAKAVNWPEEFYEEVMNEDCGKQKIALRIGSLYYEHGYFVPSEVVDIRVNHKAVRKASIDAEMYLSKIKDLSEETLSKYKKRLQTAREIAEFLKNNYNQEITEESIVTVITYINLPFENEVGVEDPHLS
jgi:hypothetical protein